MIAFGVLLVVACVALAWRRRSLPVLVLLAGVAWGGAAVGAPIVVDALAVAAGIALVVTAGHARWQWLGTPQPTSADLLATASYVPVDRCGYGNRVDLEAIARTARTLAYQNRVKP